MKFVASEIASMMELQARSEPSISSSYSNRANKRTISSSSSSSSSSAGFDSYCVSLAVGPLWWSWCPNNPHRPR